MLHAVIMAGGGGTRFWPRSRKARPKQFLTLAGDRSLLQMALDRVEGLAAPEHTWVVTGEAYRAETAVQLPTLPPERIVGEPCGRDTAPCIGLGAALIVRDDPDAVMLTTPADHVIEPVQEFRRAVLAAVQTAEEHPSALVTFGIPPTFPSTGYGYIHRGAEAGRRNGVGVWRVRGFREKPNADLAERFLHSGEYLWNSGIFVWKVAAVLAQLREQRPLLYSAVQRVADAWKGPTRSAVLRSEYEAMEKVSIDYAVMEHAPEVLVVQAPYRWDDVGSWLALERMNPQDADGNTVQATHAGVNTKGCVIVGDPGRLIGTIGVSNLLIIQDGDATLVADRREEGAVKQLVELLQKKGLEKYLVSAGRLLGVDYGEVRVGLSVSDPDRKIAFPLATYTRQSRERDAAYFRELTKAEQVVGLVVGLPVHLSGKEGQKAAAAREFAAWLTQTTGLAARFWDERFTTVEAESALWAAGLTHKQRQARRDKVAAQMLLQAYLDAGCPSDAGTGPLEG